MAAQLPMAQPRNGCESEGNDRRKKRNESVKERRNEVKRAVIDATTAQHRPNTRWSSGGPQAGRLPGSRIDEATHHGAGEHGRDVNRA